MARLEYFIVAESLSVDQATNRISFFNIYEEIHTRGFPFHLPQMVAVSAWNAEPGDGERDFQSLTRITLPNGTNREFRQNFRITGRRHRVMLTYEQVPVEQAGHIVFQVELNGNHAAEHTIDIINDLPPA